VAHREDCPICLNPLLRGTEVRCGHTFHARCIEKWLRRNSTCPICRNILRDTYRISIRVQNVTSEENVREFEVPPERSDEVSRILELPSADSGLVGAFEVAFDVHGLEGVHGFIDDLNLGDLFFLDDV